MHACCALMGVLLRVLGQMGMFCSRSQCSSLAPFLTAGKKQFTDSCSHVDHNFWVLSS